VNTEARLTALLADHYRIERELGRGGMATVYLAHDLRHDRPVALKVLHPDLASTLGPDRFQREIKLAARLQHPHILGVHDSGETGGFLWFTMPYIEGESLRNKLERERQLPLEEAVRIAREAADALDYAHQHGVVHRDIKPENILLSSGHALVADFGIARALSDGAAGLTGTGMIVGTPAYMAPEQAAGEKQIDGRADLYALGCVLYEMLAGEPPFTGPSAQAIITRSLTESPRPLHTMRGTIPSALDLVVAKAMAKVPADRYGSAAEFARALGAAAELQRVEPPASRAGGRRKVSPALLLVIGILIGVGGLFAWKLTSGSSGGGTSERTIAVLPFENQGAPEDQYFADGMSDEVRGRLATVAGLTVIARGSSNEYRESKKGQAEIARELGARYLLTATVRWEKSGGQSRVRVTPELVEIRPGATPSTRWQQPFDAVLSDVFKVQAEIAGQVTQALDVALAPKEKAQLESRPTSNLAAYDAYLKANELRELGLPEQLLHAVELYGRAVALDSTFVLAWSQLSRSNSLLYWVSSPKPEYMAAARQAAARSAALAPNAAATYKARGDLHRYIENNWNAAIAQYNLARQADPQDADVLSQIAFSQQGAGLWKESAATLVEGIKVDPRSVAVQHRLARCYLWLRQYPEALREVEKLQILTPASPQALQVKVMIHLAQGDLAGARKLLQPLPQGMDPTDLVAFFANYWDLYWILTEEQQQLLLRLPMGPFGNDRSAWAIVRAQTLYQQGNLPRARVYADSARISMERVIADSAGVTDAQFHAFLGLAHAILGNQAAAVQEGEKAVQITPVNQDAYTGVYLKYMLARIYLMVGESDRAIDQLDGVLRIPFYVSPGWLRVDPEWDPIRNNPRFQALAKQ
jgi:eukaryotic-like serine/threonine-protein kinase